MDEEPAIAEPSRYRAFISYSHTDAKFAHWLHRKLESWRLPDKTRLTPVFIDRAELSAGSDLSAQVQAALSESAALVVVCSPNARASRWVGQEINLFRKLHPGRPVLAALIEGEPDEAFPDPLVRSGDKAIEPLAADFRKGHDGQRLGLIKLVAGLSGLPLDRLVQRDAAARQRRVMAVTASALALVLVLSAALIIALRARAEAERQRAEAEGLVEFMLTDLRDKLRGTGDPKIMATVNQRALDYYSRMDVTSLPDDSLERRARVLHAMGEDNERLGNFPAAQKMYLEAWRITDEVLKRHPKEPDAIFAHAQSEFWVGQAAWLQGDLETTERHWRRYLKGAEALSIAQPKSQRSLMELGFANGNLCELTSRKSKRPDEALKFCERAVEFMREARTKFPTETQVAIALANRLGWQADLLERMGKFAESIELRMKEAEILDSLISNDRKNLDLRVRRLWPEIGIGKTLIAWGRIDQGIDRLVKCLHFYDEIAKIHPNDLRILREQMRASWLAARAAKSTNHPKYRYLLIKTSTIYLKLKSNITENEMDRFDKMMAQLTK